MKRENYISFDELFMGIALLSSQRSKDPRTQIGACIINQKNRIVSIGYNGLSEGISDDEFSWDREKKKDYVIHAEANAILNATVSLDGCIMYLYSDRGYYPCCECAKQISQSGIKEVVVKFISTDPNINKMYKGDATIKMFNAAGITIRVLEDN